MEESQSRSDTSCSLPEDCVAQILSLTSPRDACAAAAVCWTFRSAADSDLVWEGFLPPDYKDILSRAVRRVAFSSKKELFARLCRPLLIDGGTKSFSLDKTTGKKCFMLSAARAFGIPWKTPPKVGDLIFHPMSRFSEVALPVNLYSWGIGRILKGIALSPKTTYVAYLIFNPPSGKSLPLYQGLEVLFSLPVAMDATSDNQISKRSDGWMEKKINEFYYDGESDEIADKLLGTTVLFWMSNFILEGIELRPKN